MLASNERVCVIDDSGRDTNTIGRLGVVVRVVSESMNAFPSDPEHWIYCVRIKETGGIERVKAGRLAGTGQIVAEGPHSCRRLEIHFGRLDEARNCEVSGAFRFGNQNWVEFSVSSVESDAICYKLWMPVGSNIAAQPRLEIRVPKRQRVSPEEIRDAILGIYGVTSPDP